MTLPTLQIDRVTFEHHHDGFGINTGTPRLSWSFSELTKSSYGWEQDEYEIEIQPNDTRGPQQFRVLSKNSVLVPWPDQPLQSREIANVRVRAYGKLLDGTEQSTEWSTWTPVEVALLAQSEWTAQLISAKNIFPRLFDDGSLRPLRFRKEFLLPSQSVVRARLYSTAHGVYNAYVNGRAVGQDCMAPGWTSYKHRLYYQIYDITTLLRSGAVNIIGIEAAAGWFAGALGWGGGRRFLFGDNIGILAQLEIEFTGTHERITISSDDTWKVTHSAIIQSEIYSGETFDSRADNRSWHSPEFSTSSWTAVHVEEAPPSTKLISPEAPPVRVTEEIKAIQIIKTPNGQTIVDFGQNLVGKLQINSVTKPSGHQIAFVHAEVLENGELGIRPLRDARCTDTVICKGDTISKWTPSFTFHGFRYVQVNGWAPDDTSDPLTLSSITALVLHTDMRRTGWFECSQPHINRLHDNALWSMRGNFFSIPTDCPQRDERMGWTGDIQIFSPSANFLYDTCGMLSGWLEDVAAEQLLERDGAIPPLVVPNVIHRVDENVPDHWWPHIPQAVWDDVTVITPWDLYRAFSDSQILHRQYESMKTWVDRGVRRGPDGLWDPDFGQLGDWLDPHAPPNDPANGRTDGVLVADAYLVRVTWIISETALVLGFKEDASRYQDDYTRLKHVFQQRYITPTGLLVADTQTALALAIVFDLFATAQQQQVAGARLVRAVRQADFRVSTGFVGTPIITHALTKIGKAQYAYRMLLEKQCPSWMYPISMGATTIWERWDSMLPDGSINPGTMTSFNHYALGSIVNWLHETVGGISPLGPGFQKIKVQPIPGGPLTHATVRHDSPYGKIEAAWKLKGEEFELEILVPANSTAYVILPDQGQTDAVGKGVWVGSGRHHFTCNFVPRDSWPPSALYLPFLIQELEGNRSVLIE